MKRLLVLVAGLLLVAGEAAAEGIVRVSGAPCTHEQEELLGQSAASHDLVCRDGEWVETELAVVAIHVQFVKADGAGALRMREAAVTALDGQSIPFAFVSRGRLDFSGAILPVVASDGLIALDVVVRDREPDAGREDDEGEKTWTGVVRDGEAFTVPFGDERFRLRLAASVKRM